MARWLLLVVTASLLGLVLAPALVAAVGPGTGFIEVCKDSDGSGVSGTFRFTVGSQTVAVPVGACSAPLQLPVGPVTVTEEAVAGVGVASIAVWPVDRQLSASPATRSAQVNVVAGGVAGQTLVTFTNRSEMGILTVCKAAGAGIAQGTNFTFVVAGRSIAVPAGQCAGAGSFPFGSLVTVAEVLEPGTRVSDISVSPPNRMVGAPSLTDGVVTVSIGMLSTQVTFTNEAVLQGSLQICKQSDATNVTGTFTFTVAGQRVDVPVGLCSGVLRLPEGVVTVSEVPRGDSQVAGIVTTPTARLVQADLAAGTAQVQIVAGSLLQLTTVTFTNQLQTGQVKVCKVAGPGVSLGAPFDFTVAGQAITVPAGSCALAGTFPINTLVPVSEVIPAGMRVTAIRVAPPERVSGAVILGTASVTVVAGPGVTEVSFTNQSVTTTTVPSIPPTTTTVPMSTSTTVPLVGPTTTTPIPTTTTTVPPPATTSTTASVLVTTSTTTPGTSTTAVPFASTSTSTTVPTTLPATTSTTTAVLVTSTTVAPVVVPTSTTAVPPVSTDTDTTGPNASTTTTSLPCVPPTTTPLLSSSTSNVCILTPALSTPTTIAGRLVERVTPVRLAITGNQTFLLLLAAAAAIVVGLAILLVPPRVAGLRAGRHHIGQQARFGRQRQRYFGARRPRWAVPHRHRARDVWRR